MSLAKAIAAPGVLLALLSSCTWAGNQPDHPERKAFTVGVTERFNRLDPAAGGQGLSDAMILASFQRLQAVNPDNGLLAPDAAECMAIEPLVFRCRLEEDLEFIDGRPLDAAAVRHSLERAIALDPSGRARVLFSAVRRIEADPGGDIVTFVLSRPDNQFGYALAAPVASIVSPAAYPPDRIRPATRLAVGSGPYRMEIITERRVGFSAYANYTGAAPSGQQRLSIQRYDASEFLRTAMTNQEVDVAWGGLDAQQQAALEVQADANPLGVTRDGFRPLIAPGARTWYLTWAPRSPLRDDADARRRVADALAKLRTDPTYVPGGPAGCSADNGTPEPRTGPPLRLTLTFDPAVADEALRAERVRAAFEAAGIEALLRPNDARADLRLGDPEPETENPVAWLLPWLVAPLPESADAAAAALARYGAAASVADQAAALGELCRLAAADQTALPVWREARVTWIGPGISAVGRAYLGPGDQLGVWGFRW